MFFTLEIFRTLLFTPSKFQTRLGFKLFLTAIFHPILSWILRFSQNFSKNKSKPGIGCAGDGLADDGDPSVADAGPVGIVGIATAGSAPHWLLRLNVLCGLPRAPLLLRLAQTVTAPFAGRALSRSPRTGSCRPLAVAMPLGRLRKLLHGLQRSRFGCRQCCSRTARRRW